MLDTEFRIQSRSDDLLGLLNLRIVLAKIERSQSPKYTRLKINWKRVPVGKRCLGNSGSAFVSGQQSDLGQVLE